MGQIKAEIGENLRLKLLVEWGARVKVCVGVVLNILQVCGPERQFDPLFRARGRHESSCGQANRGTACAPEKVTKSIGGSTAQTVGAE
jgi:hypothetical protein